MAESGQEELTALGISDQEAPIYTGLFLRSKTIPELAEEFHLSRSRVQSLVSALTTKGLLSRVPGRPVRFTATPPERILPVLVAQREQEVLRLKSLVEDLSQRYRAQRGAASTEDYIEVVTGTKAVLAQLLAHESAATSEILYFVKAPILSTDNPEAEEGFGRGVLQRALWERELLEQPGMMEAASEWSTLGGEDRVVPWLPSKLVIIDRATAFINVTETTPEGPVIAGLRTSHPELVATFCQLFEMLWNVGVPLFPEQADATGDRGMDEVLVACLKAGMTDASIARQLGCSVRTVTRRAKTLLDALNVDTRFQAGYRVRDLELSGKERAPATR